MTVRELIEALQALTEEQKDLEVQTEGCDCYGDCASIKVEKKYVLLERGSC